jgi:NhaA family Na+:H+ antiporter
LTRRTNRFQRAWIIARDNSLLMVAGAIVALLWANLHPASYTRTADALHFAINDIAMAFFFGLAMKEIIEATAPGGALHSVRRAAMPVVAALGGMVGPAALYVVLVLAFGRPDMLRGWAIPCATDIAFSYLVIRAVFRPTHGAVPFLLLLAIADDAFGLVLLAAFYPTTARQPIPFVVLVGLACALAFALRSRNTRSFWPYVGGAGALSWAGFYLGGFHPALALVPVLPFVPHAARDPGLYVDGDSPPHDPLNAFEHWWSTPVEFILFFFALANAGLPITQTGALTWIVLVSLLAGKPIGIGIATWCAERVGLRRPEGVGWREMVVVGFAAGIGFTVALFFASAAFPPGETMDHAKLGAMLSVSAAVLALAAAQALGVGKRDKIPA